MKMIHKKLKILITVLVLIALIGVGYATLGANLKINGVADIPASTWNVQFKTDSIAVTSGSVTGENVTTDAMIDSVVSKFGTTEITTGTLPSYIDYSVTYSDGISIMPHHLLVLNTAINVYNYH